ncbi:MAG: molybdopterin cofactor-binding domain-containing protein [Verrucomicrobiota bacterium]
MSIALCSRRDFVKATGLTLSGLIIGFRSDGAPATNGSAFQPNGFIAIDPQDGITLSIACPEIGQNIRTTFAMILADELGADLDQVTLHQSSPRNDLGRQTAGGSGSVRTQFVPLREAAAAAREMLIAGAAQKLGVSASQCKAEKSMIIAQNGGKMTFAEAAGLARSVPVPNNPRLKPNSEFSYIGKAKHCMDSLGIVTGKVKYGADALPENCAFAIVLRSPVYQGKLRNYDAEAAKQMSGVKDIVRFGDKIAVIATDTWSAINASKAVKVRWKNGANGNLDSATLATERKNAVQNPKQTVFKKGNFTNAYAGAKTTLETEFVVPTITHVPLEPPNCTAWYHNGGVEIWGSCQVLNRLYKDLPKMTGLPRDKVKYHQLRIGGGFGRKLATDYVEEALEIAKQVNYPVKMIFSREDDIRNGRFRVPDQYKFRVGLGRNGYPEAIEETSVRRALRKKPSEIVRLFRNAERKFSGVEAGLHAGPLRAPNHNITSFVEQSLINMMAIKAGIDPIDYQLALHGDPDAVSKLKWKRGPMKQQSHMCDLLKTVRKQSGWKQDSRYGYGVATFSGYGSHCALVALIPKNGGSRPVEKVFCAVHCGQVINPLGAHAQIEGGIIDCLGATLYQKITLQEGRVQESNFHDYKLLRMPEHPDVEVTIAESNEAPQGLGEVSYPPMAAATTNALHDARGRWFTELPLRG